jgi:hypothetical protein
MRDIAQKHVRPPLLFPQFLLHWGRAAGRLSGTSSAGKVAIVARSRHCVSNHWPRMIKRRWRST